MISYAQNFEDVILSRVLADVARGCYIDVGAHDPDIDTVSKAFFEKGWFGVHVEPVSSFAQMLRERRPGDVVLQAAISNGDGLISFHSSDSTGLSTAIAEIAKAHEEQGVAKFTPIYVPSVSLATIFERVTNAREVHWLKIDVEGSEADVLKSWGNAQVRPWIVVVESTAPMSTRQTFEAWEHELIERGYTFAYFDGLNRFYVSSGQLARKKLFEFPPNVFDNFKLAATTTFANQLGAQAAAQQESVRNQLSEGVLGRLAVLDSIQQNLSSNTSKVQFTLDALQENLSVVNRNIQSQLTQGGLERLAVLDSIQQNLTSNASNVKFTLDALQEKLSTANSNMLLSLTQTEASLTQDIHGFLETTQIARQEESELISKKIDEASGAQFLHVDRFGKAIFSSLQALSQELTLLRREAGEKLEKHKEMLEDKGLINDQLLQIIHHLSIESESSSAALVSYKKSISSLENHLSVLAMESVEAKEDAKRLREELEFWKVKSDSYRMSNSWKVTAPLRAASSWFRRG